MPAYKFTEEEWGLFASHLHYHQGKYDDRPGLKNWLPSYDA